MTEQVTTNRTKMAPPAASPCGSCPWLVSNQGKPHPDGWYTRANRRRLWSGLRQGEHMTCHSTDPDNPQPSDGSGKPIPEDTATRVCAGAHTLVIESLNAWNNEVTLKDRSRMTKLGMAAHIERMLFRSDLFPGSATIDPSRPVAVNVKGLGG